MRQRCTRGYGTAAHCSAQPHWCLPGATLLSHSPEELWRLHRWRWNVRARGSPAMLHARQLWRLCRRARRRRYDRCWPCVLRHVGGLQHDDVSARLVRLLRNAWLLVNCHMRWLHDVARAVVSDMVHGRHLCLHGHRLGRIGDEDVRMLLHGHGCIHHAAVLLHHVCSGSHWAMHLARQGHRRHGTNVPAEEHFL